MRSRFFLTAVICAAVVHFHSHAEEDNLDPSIVEFHMSGIVDGGTCKLTGYVYLGGQNPAAVDLKAFKIERTSAGGETQTVVLAPEFQASNNQNANERTFTWIDATAKAGDTYRYVGTYQADVYLSTCPVVLTKPVIASPATTPKFQDSFQVEVLGEPVCMGNHVLLFRARATDPKAVLNWSPVQPCMGKLLAQHKGTALIRAPAEVGAGHAFFKIEAKAGGKTAEAFICPNVVSMSFVPVEEYDPAEIKEVTSKSEKGKTILRAKLEHVYGKNGSTPERFMLRDYLIKVGNVADVLHDYMDKMDEGNAKYAVFSLIASQWPSYGRKHFLVDALTNNDLPRISAIDLSKGEDGAELLEALRACLVHHNPAVRLIAISAIERWKKNDDVLPILDEIVKADSNAAVRFEAAKAIQHLLTGKRIEIPRLPQYGSVTSSRADKQLARNLYLKALSDSGKPIQEDAFDEKHELYVPAKGNSLGGLIAEDWPAGLDAIVQPNSALAQLCVLGDAVIPIIRKRFLSSSATINERELLKWVLEKNQLQFPSDIEAEVVKSFFEAKLEERGSVLKFYSNLGLTYPRLVDNQFAAFRNGEYSKFSSTERLRVLAEVDSWMRSVFKDHEGEVRTLLAAVQLGVKPNFTSGASQEPMVWVWRLLQEQGDDIGVYARKWPENDTPKPLATNGNLPAQPAEKVYNEHTLKEWTATLNKERENVFAMDALLHFGPEGVKILLSNHHGEGTAILDVSSLSPVELTAIAPALIEALKDKKGMVRRSAPEWISQLPPEVRKTAIPALIAALSDEDIPVRFWAAQALGNIGADAKAAVPQLIIAMESTDKDLSTYASNALAGIGAGAKDAVPYLIARFRNAKNDFERCNVPYLLGKIGPVTPEVLPLMLEALKDKGHNTRNAAAMGLAEMHASEAISPLIDMLKDVKEMSVGRISAAEALEKIGGSKEAIEALAAVARDQSGGWEFRGAAMKTLAHIDKDVSTALPVLQEALGDKDAMVEIKAAETIADLGDKALPAVPQIVKLLQDRDGKKDAKTTARLLVIQALAKMTRDEKVRAALEIATTDPYSTNSRLAKEALSGRENKK